jgi:hypothetical protein
MTDSLGRSSAATNYRLPNKPHIVSSHAMASTTACKPRCKSSTHTFPYPQFSVRVSHPFNPRPTSTAASTRHPQTHTHSKNASGKSKSHNHHMPLHFACHPTDCLHDHRFSIVTQHHVVCRVVSGVSSPRLHPQPTTIQVCGAEGRHCVCIVSCFRRWYRHCI